MRSLAPLTLMSCACLVLAGCNPYMAAVGVVTQTYGVATDERSLSTQAADTETEASIKAGLLESPVSGTSGISVYCRRGVVVLTGVVPPGSQAGRAAVRITRQASGVRRVETFFVASRPSEVGDIELEGKIKAAFVADPSVNSDQVSAVVYGGHAVLIGIVGNADQIDQFVEDARSVNGVVSVRSYIQIAS